MLDATLKRLATVGRNIAPATTLFADGTPQTQPVWIDADDDHLLFNTEVGRQKFRNITRDPRVTVAIWDAEHPYEYRELRGIVTETVQGPEARAHIDQLAQKYTGQDYAAPIKTERVIVKVSPKG